MEKKLLRVGLFIATIFILFMAFSGEEDNNSNQSPQPPVKVEKKESVEASKSTESEEQKKREEEEKRKQEEERKRKEAEKKAQEEAQSNLEQDVLNLMNDSISMVDAVFDKETKTFALNITDEEVITELALIFSGAGDIEEWNYLVESLVILSENTTGALGSGYSILLLNPLNQDNTLLLILDGVIIYDVADSL